jgi:Tfp pilus tip-associated adhesin PilY1
MVVFGRNEDQGPFFFVDGGFKMWFQTKLKKDFPVGPFRIILLIMAFVAMVSPYGPVFADSSISDYSVLPPFLSRGVTPNVLVILDNSNSMDEDVSGAAVGSSASNSRSEIARQAVLTLIEKNASKMNIGLMAYQQANVSRLEIHNAAYYCSYNPNGYNATATPTPKDPTTNTLRYPNPSDPGNYIYYDVALPFYAASSQGTSFLYSHNFSEDGESTNDNYRSYRDKTGVLDPPSGATDSDLTGIYGYANYHTNYTFIPTDEDIAAGFTEFGEQMFWVHIGPTWFSNSSPGKGYLHVPIVDSTTAHITALGEKLGTSNFSTTASDHPNSDLNTPLRNAGLTPLAGALESACLNFQGNLPVDQGGPQAGPVQYWCQKNFVVLVTDGLPSVDKNGNAADSDTLLPGVKNEVQLLRSTGISGFTDPFDIQTFVLGFALPPELGSKLDDIAVAGGTDIDGHAYLAGNADELAQALQSIFLEILNRISSGSAASVISNSRSGEGAIYQSIFFPEYRDSSGNTVNWIGNTHSLFIDAYGNMREDTDGNYTLDLNTDRIVEFDGNTTKAKLYDYNATTETKTLVTDNATITDIKFIWNALSWLSDSGMDATTQRDYTLTDHERYIFTDYIDIGCNVSMTNIDSTNIMDFTTDFVDDPTHDNYYFLNPDLTYDDDNNASTPEVGLTESQMITEAKNIIRFVRGEEGLSETGTGTPYRSRTLDTDGDGSGDTVFRLGDIIHSTPTVVSQPSENYDLLYRDDSYGSFRKKYLNRRNVVYAGANDGMLHAFNGGFYDAGAHKFNTQPKVWDNDSSSFIPDTSYTDYDLGSELWAYVPNALLPHLNWLKESFGDNTPVYYVDLKHRGFDARIFYQANGTTPLDADHPNGWGTVLIGGMRLGGGPISVDTDEDGNTTGPNDLSFRSTYFALDITNPEVAPMLLWSFSDDNLGFTTSYSTSIRVGSKWFIVIGSGPADYEATRKDDGVNFTEYGGSNSTASVYILNADDGTPAREFSMDSYSFMAAPIAADFDLVTTVDNGNILWTGEAIYIASDGCVDLQEGRVFRITTNDDENPDNWIKDVFFNPNTTSGSDHQHINTALSVARDDEGRIWVYFGTGRFWSSLDRQSPYLSYQNTFYGIKEPVDANGTLTYATPGAVKSNLKNVTGIEIEDYNTLSLNTSNPLHGAAVSDQDGDGNVTFSDLMAEVQAKDGWYLNFDETGERNLGQAAVLGDIVTFSTFVPNNDLCAYEGRSYLYGLYYKTGTAYWKGVLKADDNNWTGVNPITNKVVSKIDIGKGYSETANIHTGRERGSKAFVQTSTGAIIGIEQANPGITKSNKTSWQEILR